MFLQNLFFFVSFPRCCQRLSFSTTGICIKEFQVFQDDTVYLVEVSHLTRPHPSVLPSVSPWWWTSVPALVLVFPPLLFLLFLQLVQSFSLLLCCTLDVFDATLQSAAIRRTEHAQTLQGREDSRDDADTFGYNHFLSV